MSRYRDSQLKVSNTGTISFKTYADLENVMLISLSNCVVLRVDKKAGNGPDGISTVRVNPFKPEFAIVIFM